LNNKELVKHYYEVIVSSNMLDELPNYLREDDVQEMCKHLLAIRNTYPDFSIHITRQFEDGEYIISEFVMKGTHKGEFLGIKPTYKIVEIVGVNIDRVKNGLIIEHKGAANTLEAFIEKGII